MRFESPSRSHGPGRIRSARRATRRVWLWAGMASLLVWPAVVQAQAPAAPVTPAAPAQSATPSPSSPDPQAAPSPPVEAQAAAPAAPAVQAVTFTTPAGALLMSVLAARTADFESLMALFVEALAASQDDSSKALATGLKIYKAGEPAPGGANALYVIVIDPAVPDADYSWQAILSRIVAAFPDKQQDVFEKGTSVHAGPMSKLTLTPLGPAR